MDEVIPTCALCSERHWYSDECPSSDEIAARREAKKSEAAKQRVYAWREKNRERHRKYMQKYMEDYRSGLRRKK